MQNWKKIGLIFEPDTTKEWEYSHAQLPTPYQISDNIYRVYFAGRTKGQRSHISFFDFDLKSLTVVNKSTEPVLTPGNIGTFDEHGVYPASIVKNKNKLYMYYIGWNQGVTPPLFYASIGLAISEDNGSTFYKFSKAPIMSRNKHDPCMVTSPHVYKDKNSWQMSYVSGLKWEEINGELQSYYHIKQAESSDGITWKQDGHIAIDFIDDSESNIARPSVIKENDLYKMWYSYARDGKGYRIGYAESSNGDNWTRKDNKFNLDISKDDFDSEIMCYPCVLQHEGKKYMFYNGNNFGKCGVGLASSDA